MKYTHKRFVVLVCSLFPFLFVGWAQEGDTYRREPTGIGADLTQGGAFSFSQKPAAQEAVAETTETGKQASPPAPQRIPSAKELLPPRLDDGIQRLPAGHTTEQRRAAIMNYFKLANKEMDSETKMILLFDREIPDYLEKKIRKRDENRCVICGSRKKVKPDMARARINGGQPVLSNLFCLCGACQKTKTAIDRKFHDSLKANGYRFGSL